jgi:3-oxoacyl-[acyl-carrier protein] reductase
MDLGLTGKVTVVLGSTSGLGRASAEALAAEGAHVVVVGRRKELVDEVAAALPSAIGVVADLAEPDAPARIAEAAREAFGRVDVLVLNGGGPAPGAAPDLTADGARAATDLLLAPHVAMVQEVLPGMRERGWGRIVAIGSSGVQQPIPTLTSSNVGRAALAAYLKTLAGSVARDGVTVNMVLPGRIDTDRVASLDAAAAERTGKAAAEVRDASENSIPAGRYGAPDEFASVVTFLAGQPAAYVTGEQVRCDGGMVAGY